MDAVIISIGAITSSGTGSPSNAAMRPAHAPAQLTITGAASGPLSVSTRHTPSARRSP